MSNNRVVRYPEMVLLNLPRTTLSRVDAVLRENETRADALRNAVAMWLERREAEV